jgi:phosphoglycerate dehydrogenase-like enzyme
MIRLLAAASVLLAACASASGSLATISSAARPSAALQARPLTYLAGELTSEEEAELRALAPNVRVLGNLTRESALEHAAEADGTDARFLSAEFLARATKLTYAQAMGVGVDRWMHLEPLVKNDRIQLANLRGSSGPAIAEHVFAMLLSLTRDLRFHLENQSSGRWARDGSGVRPIALAGRTMLVVGLGGIGSEVADRAHGFGMRVIATRRSDAASPSWIDHVGKPAELLAMLPEADVVAICVPLTPETEHLFDAKAFAAMKKESYLVNVARGKIVDTQALLDALGNGRLAGACLDVTDPEPLPPDHPLWKLRNVVVTPHVSSDAELTDDRQWAAFKENFRRFGAGESLLNVVDKKAGY